MSTPATIMPYLVFDDKTSQPCIALTDDLVLSVGQAKELIDYLNKSINLLEAPVQIKFNMPEKWVMSDEAVPEQ